MVMSDIPAKPHSAADTLRTDAAPTGVNTLFFSQTNVDALHEGVRYLVFKFSNCKHVIDKQSDTELQIIMKGVYMEHARNVEFNVLSQVRQLNALVLDFAVPRILREINMHITYQNQALKNPLPLQHPVAVSSAGTKSLEFRRG
jgi:hypothetical protein